MHCLAAWGQADVVGPGHWRIPVPGRPFGLAFSADGAALFVALDGDRPELAMFSVADHVLEAKGRVPLDGEAGEVAVSHDGRLLAVAEEDAGVGFYDVAKLQAGESDARIALLATGPTRSSRGSGTIGVGFSKDDAVLLATDESQARVSVFDVARLRDPSTRDSALRGAAPAGLAPVGIAFSDDGRSALVASEIGPGASLPADCTGPQGGRRPAGIVTTIDLAKALAAPADSVVSASAAGCEPVRLAFDKGRVYVSSRGDNAVRVLDPAKFARTMSRLRQAPDAAGLDRFQVGEQPVGLAVVADLLIVANSHRFSGGPADISVLDLASGRILATVPAAAFPREIATSPDGRLAVVGDFQGRALELLDLEGLALRPSK